jgi:hypothetical protein
MRVALGFGVHEASRIVIFFKKNYLNPNQHILGFIGWFIVLL